MSAILSTEEVRRLVEDRQRAIATYRAADDPSTQKRAWEAGEDARAALDDHLVALTEQREAEQAAACTEARARAAGIIAGSAAVKSNEDETREVREFLDPDNPRKSFRIDLESRANEEWWSDTGSTVKAGYTVPTSVHDRVVYHINSQSGVFGSAYKLMTATGEDITVPTLATDATANLTAEKTASTITNPVFGSETLASYRLDGHFVLSNELLRDSAVNVERVVGDAAGRAIATKLGGYLATGTGSGEPEGVTVGSTLGVTAQAVDSVTFGEVIELYYAVLPGARKNGTWVAGSDTILSIAQMTNDNGDYIWKPAVDQGRPDTLLGKPIFEDADFPSLGTGNKVMVFGDFDYYWLRIVARGNTGGILVELDSSVGFTSFTTYARFAMWVDSRVMGTGGEIKHLICA